MTTSRKRIVQDGCALYFRTHEEIVQIVKAYMAEKKLDVVLNGGGKIALNERSCHDPTVIFDVINRTVAVFDDRIDITDEIIRRHEERSKAATMIEKKQPDDANHDEQPKDQ